MIVSPELKSLFPSLDAGFLAVLENEGTIKHFKAGEVIMRPGQFVRSTMLVVEGLVKVYRQDDEGSEFFLYHISPGQACAISIVCAMGAQTSQIAARAVVDTSVILIPVNKMEELMAAHKSWNHFIIETYRQRFEELLQTLDSVAFRNMDDRLEFYLKRMQEKLNTNLLTITHLQIAHDLNSSREVISRLLKKLSERGKIVLHRNYLEIVAL